MYTDEAAWPLPTGPKSKISRVPRALITGIAGQDGSLLAELLLSEGVVPALRVQVDDHV